MRLDREERIKIEQLRRQTRDKKLWCTRFVGQLPVRDKMGELLTDFVLCPYPVNIPVQG